VTLAPERPQVPVRDWVAVCTLSQLLPERGVAVLVGGEQVALFRVTGSSGGPLGRPSDTVHAVGHRDPFSGAHVMARGILGSAGDRDTVASPMYKQVFDLRTGECLTEPGVRLPVHRTRVVGGVVHVAVVSTPPGSAPGAG
jgi:nitrite reductase (NADH) small subunit